MQKCDKNVNSLAALNDHRKENHEKIIKCKHCVEFWKVETHMKTHREVR